MLNTDIHKRRPLYLLIGLSVNLLILVFIWNWNVETVKKFRTDSISSNIQFDTLMQNIILLEIPVVIEEPALEEVKEEKPSETVEKEPIIIEKTEEKKKDLVNKADTTAITKEANPTLPSTENNEGELLTDRWPEPVGGYETLNSHISKSLQKPSQALQKGITGKVYLEFVIEKNGELSKIKVIDGKGLGFGCDEEAIRLLSSGPKWNPAVKNGKKIAIRYMYQIKF